MYKIDYIDIYVGTKKTKAGLLSVVKDNMFSYTDEIFKEADILLRHVDDELYPDLRNCVSFHIKTGNKKFKFVFNIDLEGNTIYYSHFDKEENLKTLKLMKDYFNSTKSVKRLEQLMIEENIEK